MNKKKSTGILLSVLAVISLVLITAGVTYAFFTYAKEGQTENSLTTGTIKFLYDEVSQQGQGIAITNALPMTDDQGKVLAEEGQKFEFTINSTVTGNADIKYVVTARQDPASTLPNDTVKVYLTAEEALGEGEQYYTDTSNKETRVFNTLKDLNSQVSALGLSDDIVEKNVTEKVLFVGKVPAKEANYSKTFTLRMWINGGNEESVANSPVDYSAYEFVKKDADGINGTEPLVFDTLFSAGKIITSTDYYKLTSDQDQYERIAYVDEKNGKLYTVSQAVAQNWLKLDDHGNYVDNTGKPDDAFTKSEQYYRYNGKEFKIKVNVYANAVVVGNGI